MEKINVAELLKDYPSGMELDCALFNKPVKFDGIDKDYDLYPIRVKIEDNTKWFDKYGCIYSKTYAKCVIYPKGKTTWDGFYRPFKDGDIVAYDNPHRDNLQVFIFKSKKENNTLSSCYLMLDGDELDLEEGMYYVTRLASEEEKQKLFQAIKDNGYKWNPETKTLDKLAPNKFDINTLKPFDKVLTRTTNGDVWGADLFGWYKDGWFLCNGHIGFRQCIPYKENEHLLGTTNDCDDFYKTW